MIAISFVSKSDPYCLSYIEHVSPLFFALLIVPQIAPVDILSNRNIHDLDLNIKRTNFHCTPREFTDFQLRIFPQILDDVFASLIISHNKIRI